MIEKNMKTLGLRQMHPMQVMALIDFIGDALSIAAVADDREIFNDMETSADELVRLFGGVGVTTTPADHKQEINPNNKTIQ